MPENVVIGRLDAGQWGPKLNGERNLYAVQIVSVPGWVWFIPLLRSGQGIWMTVVSNI